MHIHIWYDNALIYDVSNSFFHIRSIYTNVNWIQVFFIKETSLLLRWSSPKKPKWVIFIILHNAILVLVILHPFQCDKFNVTQCQSSGQVKILCSICQTKCFWYQLRLDTEVFLRKCVKDKCEKSLENLNIHFIEHRFDNIIHSRSLIKMYSGQVGRATWWGCWQVRWPLRYCW